MLDCVDYTSHITPNPYHLHCIDVVSRCKYIIDDLFNNNESSNNNENNMSHPKKNL